MADILLAETSPDEVEIKPDGILYLPEIKYRRILNKAFGPGGWGLVPRSESIVTAKTVTREYALVCNGRYVPLPLPFPRSFLLVIMWLISGLFADLFPSLAVSKIISLPMVSRLRQRAVAPTP